MMAMLFAEGSCGVSVRPLASALPISPTISDVAEVTHGEAMAAATIASRAALPRERVFVPKAVYARAPLRKVTRRSLVSPVTGVTDPEG